MLAVQMADTGGGASHRLVGEIVRDGPWAELTRPRYRPRAAVRTAPQCRWLAPHAAELDVRETECLRGLQGEEQIFRWTLSSTLLPALVHLTYEETDVFAARYRAGLRRVYVPEADGPSLYCFRRIFIVAQANA